VTAASRRPSVASSALKASIEASVTASYSSTASSNVRERISSRNSEPVYLRAVEVVETLLVVLDVDGHPELGEEWPNVAYSRIPASVGASKEL